MSSVLYKPVRRLGPAGRSRAGGRPRPVGLGVAGWGGGGAAHDPGFGAVQLDGQGGAGDGDAEGLPGVGAAEGDLLPADHDHAGGVGAALHPDRLGWWPWRGPAWAGAGLMLIARSGLPARRGPGW